MLPPPLFLRSRASCAAALMMALQPRLHRRGAVPLPLFLFSLRVCFNEDYTQRL